MAGAGGLLLAVGLLIGAHLPTAAPAAGQRQPDCHGRRHYDLGSVSVFATGRGDEVTGNATALGLPTDLAYQLYAATMQGCMYPVGRWFITPQAQTITADRRVPASAPAAFHGGAPRLGAVVSAQIRHAGTPPQTELIEGVNACVIRGGPPPRSPNSSSRSCPPTRVAWARGSPRLGLGHI
jgi:hypothetical protein